MTHPDYRTALDVVRQVLRNELGLSPEMQIQEDDSLDLLPGADSVRLMQVVSVLERRFTVEMDDTVIRKTQTVADMAHTLHDALTEGAV